MIFNSEYKKPTAGSKIKDPLLYILQLMDELQTVGVNQRPILQFLKQQGMDLLNPPNVKGWDGGRSWLTSQIFLHRNRASDALCRNKIFQGRKTQKIQTRLRWNRNGNHRSIIEELSERLLFQVDENLQNDMKSILKYDFDPSSPNAEQVVLRLFNFITKTPEFQLI